MPDVPDSLAQHLTPEGMAKLTAVVDMVGRMGAANISSRVDFLGTASAATPCGWSVATALSKTSSGSKMVST